jgi:hypothetical protein
MTALYDRFHRLLHSFRKESRSTLRNLNNEIAP